MKHVLRCTSGLILLTVAVALLSSCSCCSAGAQSSEPSGANAQSSEPSGAASIESLTAGSTVDFGSGYRGTIAHALAKSAEPLPFPLYVDATLGQEIRLIGATEFRGALSILDFVEVCARRLGGDCVVDFTDDSLAIVRGCPPPSAVVDPGAIRIDFGHLEVLDLSEEMERCAALARVRVLVDIRLVAEIQGRPPAGIRGWVALVQALEQGMASAGLDVEIVPVDGALRIRPKP